MTAYIVLVMSGGVLITLTRCPNREIMHPVTQGTVRRMYLLKRNGKGPPSPRRADISVIPESGATFKRTHFGNERQIR